MPKCLVPNCENRYKIGTKKPRMRSFFQIPQGHKDPKKWKLAKQWLHFCHIDITKFVFRQHQTICQDHFEPDLIEKVQQKVFPHGFHGQVPKRLAKGSLPTLHPAPPQTLSASQDPGAHDLAQNRLPRESSVICEKIRYQPKSYQRKQVADLARYPPDLLMPAKDINEILTCGICKSYFRDATTITECLHTFCKSCLVRHFYLSLFCPRCNVMVHPSDPFSCIKIDHTMQDLVNKIFPEHIKEEALQEINFYRSRGLEPPKAYEESEEVVTDNITETKMMSVCLDYIGTSPHLPSHYPLEKPFLRIPDSVTIDLLQKFVRAKMRLPSSCQAAMFVNLCMLSSSLTVKRVEQIFGSQFSEDVQDILVMQFGVIPQGDYFQEGLIINTKDI